MALLLQPEAVMSPRLTLRHALIGAAAIALVVAAIWTFRKKEHAAAAAAATREVEQLKAEHAALRARLLEARPRNPFHPDVLGEQDLAVAVRPAFVASLVEEVAHQYLNAVDLDLAALETNAGGVLRGKALLGKIDVGQWRVGVRIESLRGRLKAGHPRLRFEKNRIDIAMPVIIEPAPAKVTLDFAWDSSGIVNLVCRDFELVREVEGRVVGQRHVVAGSVELTEQGGFLTATPLIPDPTVPLRVELSEPSWAVVEEALRSQDSLGRCGLVLKPDQVVAKLRELADRGIEVRLPKVLFQASRLPAQYGREVTMGGRTLALSLRSEQLRIDPGLILSTASLDVAAPQASP
jgi:hypothetical protein